MGVGNERISFRVLPATKAICIYHKGAYDRLGEDIYRYDLENGYRGRACTVNATLTVFGTRKMKRTG